MFYLTRPVRRGDDPSAVRMVGTACGKYTPFVPRQRRVTSGWGITYSWVEALAPGVDFALVLSPAAGRGALAP